MVIVLKLSKKDQETLDYMLLDDTTKVNSFLADSFEQQAKSQNKQFIITLIVGILTLIVTIIGVIISLFALLK